MSPTQKAAAATRRQRRYENNRAVSEWLDRDRRQSRAYQRALRALRRMFPAEFDRLHAIEKQAEGL